MDEVRGQVRPFPKTGSSAPRRRRICWACQRAGSFAIVSATTRTGRRGCTTAGWARCRRGAPSDQVAKVPKLIDTRHFDFPVKHFHEQLAAHAIARSDTWTKSAQARWLRLSAEAPIGASGRASP